MKKVLLTATILLLSACGSTNNLGTSSLFGNQNMSSTVGNVSGSLMKMWVQNQCSTELNKRNEWRLIALAMSAEKQAEWENKICGCAGEEVPNQISAADLTNLISKEGRAKVVSDVAVKTVTACYQRLYKNSK